MIPPLPLVLLHPYPTDAGFWDRMRSHLDPGRPISAPNVPGFGDQAPRANWTIDDDADRVAAHIRAHTSDGTAAVMGLSMGGYVALSLAARHPERCARLVLADTRADGDDAPTRTARTDAIAAIRGGHLDDYLRALLPRLLSPDANPQVRSELATLAARQSPDALVDALGALANRPDRRGNLPTLEVPTLVIVGAEDQLTPPSAARKLARKLPRARLIEIPGAGHLSALESPETVAGYVETFLAEDHASP